MDLMHWRYHATILEVKQLKKWNNGKRNSIYAQDEPMEMMLLIFKQKHIDYLLL